MTDNIMPAEQVKSPAELLQEAISAADIVAPPLLERFDGVLMLTGSQWYKEPGNNRDQHARRLAKYVPIILVEPLLSEPSYYIEATEVPNLAILHIGKAYGLAGALRLNAALREIGWHNPLVWSCNAKFVDFIELRRDLYSLYHATENYIGSNDGVIGFSDDLTEQLKAMLRLVDLVVSVAEGVAVDHRVIGSYDGPSLTIPTACDFRSWQKFGDISYTSPAAARPVVFYEGYINNRLDFALIERTIELLLDWDWWFAGLPDRSVQTDWERLLSHGNVKHLGHLPLHEIAVHGKQATVGVIPFKNLPILVKSWPLKAFEYVSFGLPVVSTPVDALREFPHLFRIAETAEQFARCIREAAKERYSRAAIEMRLREAAANSSDVRFTQLMTGLTKLVADYDWPQETDSFIVTALPEVSSIALLTDGNTPPILGQLLGNNAPVTLEPDPTVDRSFDLLIATTPDAIETFATLSARARCLWFEEPPIGGDGTDAARCLLQLIDLISVADVIVCTDEVAQLLGRRLYLPQDKAIINLDVPSRNRNGALAPLAAAIGANPSRLEELASIWSEMRALAVAP